MEVTRPAVRVRTRAEPRAAERQLEDLVAAMAQQDREALASFYDATRVRVYGVVLRILRDGSAAEEVLCEVYLQAWRSAATYDPRQGGVSTWLSVLARSRAIDRLRQRRRLAQREVSLPDVEPVGTSPTPEQCAESGERRRLVREAVGRLPREQRELIELAYFSGLSHSELAATLGQPLGTVKTRIRTGMMGLRASLGALA